MEILYKPKSLFRNVAKTLLQTKGITGLYSGIVPSILRAFVVSSSRFSAYEGVLNLLRND